MMSPVAATDPPALRYALARPIRVVGTVGVSLPLDPWLTVQAVAAYASMGKRSIQDYLHVPQDPIPRVHMGARILVQKSAVDAWLRGRTYCEAEAAARLAAADARALLAARRRK